MKNFIFCFGIIGLLFIGCSPTDDEQETDPEVEELVGQDGNPRFNLQFSNSDNVDLDLYVKTPSGAIISYTNTSADDGQLDVDCQCISCPQGGNENIFWEAGSAPTGTYEYWVEYYENCASSDASSNFTVRVIQNGRVINERTGSLSSGMSTKWSHNQ